MTATVAPASPDLAASIPDILRTGKRFVAWRYETRTGQPKPAKMPYSPIMDDPRAGASSTNPAHWTTVDKAQAYAEVAGLDGIMRAFHHDDGLVGIDLDCCRDPETGEIAAWARAIVTRLDSWTEVTPSGTGLHIIVLASLPPYGRKKGDLEMYGAEGGKTGPCGRFFTMTGARLEGTPDAVGYRPDALLAIHREVFGAAPDVTAAVRDPEHPVTALELADDEVIRLASTSAHNGARFLRLWDGDSSDYASGGNDGESEADAALFEILGFYGGPAPERIERLARRSNRVREKWDRQKDYLKRSIDFAIRGKTRFYGDSLTSTPATGSDGFETCSCTDCPSRARVAFLEGRMLDQGDEIESLLSANGTLSIRLTARIAEVERLNRRIYADHRLSKVTTLTSSQKDTIRAIARVATSRAEYFDNDAPIITGQTLGAEIGKHESTARLAADAVCKLPGSPVTRGTRPRDDGERGMVTTYELAVRDPAEILEQFVVIAETLAEKVSSRPQPPRCSQHPSAPTRTYSRTVCGTCRKTLASTFPGEDALSVQNTRIGATGPTVSVPVNSPVQNTRIAGPSEPVQLARIAPLPLPLFDYAAARDSDEHWRCQCGCYERYPTAPEPGEPWTCEGCNARGVGHPQMAIAGGEE